MNTPAKPEPPAEQGAPAPVRLEENAAGVLIEVTVTAPVGTVWRYLRDPELIRRWHGWDFDGLDAEIDFIYREHAREADEPYTLQTKGGPAPGSFELGDRFDLSETGDGTVVRITRCPKGSGGDWDAMYDDITQGWISFLAQLKFAVERHPDDVRRTVFLGAGPGRNVHGLLGLAEVEPGQPYRIAPTGDSPRPPLSGAGWFRTPGQTGLVVDEYGPGLVIVAERPGAEQGESASAMVIVSTYGLDDDQFAAVETGWRSWWEAHHSQ